MDFFYSSFMMIYLHCLVLAFVIISFKRLILEMLYTLQDVHDFVT